MSILRLIGGALFVLACALTGAAQQSGQCALKPGQLPAVRGLRLGMTAAELKTIYPRLLVGPADEFGQARVELWRDRLAQVDEAAFKGEENLLTLDCDRLLLRAMRSRYSNASLAPYLNFKELGAEEVVAARVAKKRE